MQIVLAQDQAERLDGKKIAAASIAQNVPPSARSLDSVATAPGNRGTTSGVDDDAVSMVEGGCKARVTVAARCDLRVRPHLETNFLERTAIFVRRATGKKNSRAIDLLWQLTK